MRDQEGRHDDDGVHVIALDLETTTNDPTVARAVQVTIAKLPEGAYDEHKFPIDTLVNPIINIKPGATEVHGLTNDDVVDAPVFNAIAPSIQELLDQATHVIAYNGGFDLQILDRQLRDAGHHGVTPDDVTLIDPYQIFRRHVTHSLEDAHAYYLDEELDDAHDARADVLGTIRVFTQQLSDHEWPRDLDEASKPPDGGQPLDWAGKILQNEDGTPVYGFGKHQGEPVTDHPDYARWMLRKDFPPATKDLLRDLLNERRANLRGTTP